MKSVPSQISKSSGFTKERSTIGFSTTVTSTFSVISSPQESTGVIVTTSSNIPDASAAATKVGVGEFTLDIETPEASTPGNKLHVILLFPIGLISIWSKSDCSPAQISIGLPKSANGVLVILSVTVSEMSLQEPSS